MLPKFLQRYEAKQLYKIIDNPRLVVGELNRVGTRINKYIHRSAVNSGGTRVMDERWDNLIIFDGCRYDIFEQVIELEGRIEGELESRKSLASQSWEFLNKNFAGEKFHDTVYLSSNPYTHNLPEDTFHDVIDLYNKCWDDEIDTVPPWEVAQEGVKLAERYPDKRLIIHFMQPHYPFIGEKGSQIEQQHTIWNILRYRYQSIEIDLVKECYIENLELVLDHSMELLESLTGQTVLTSDHGNLIGERMWPIPVRGFGHQRSVRMEGVTKIPWFILNSSESRSIEPEPPVTSRSTPEDIVAERLSKLGYTDE